jgi:hypothetical protein
MHVRPFAIALGLIAGVLAATPAAAQYGARRFPNTNRATGETYHVEIGGYIWNPTPDIVIQSEGLGQPGDQVDFVNQLGIEKTSFKQTKIVLRPGTKHKFRFEYTPISYTSQATVPTTFVFNGQRFTVGLPVTTDVEWKAYRFGYEWDFVYVDRGFAGLLLDLKYTDIQASLTTSFAGISDTEFTHAKAPIPAIGFIGRGYVVPNISITGEFSGFKLPDFGSGSNKYGGKYFDLDIYGTVNFTDHLGVDLGYRSFDVSYLVKTTDTGTLTLKGIYVGAKARF